MPSLFLCVSRSFSLPFFFIARRIKFISTHLFLVSRILVEIVADSIHKLLSMWLFVSSSCSIFNSVVVDAFFLSRLSMFLEKFQMQFSSTLYIFISFRNIFPDKFVWPSWDNFPFECMFLTFMRFFLPVPVSNWNDAKCATSFELSFAQSKAEARTSYCYFEQTHIDVRTG